MYKDSHLPRLNDADAALADVLSLMQRQRRRQMLALMAATGAVGLPTWAQAACKLIPAATGGPFPGNATIGPNVLLASGIVRRDVRANLDNPQLVADGVPLTLTLRLVDTARRCAPLAGHAIYIWHCDARGRYSLYSPGVTTQNFLRGVQLTDADGNATFRTIIPGAYPGRSPHIHFEIYRDLAHATGGKAALRTSQLALPDAVCLEAYADGQRYPGSLAALKRTPLARDFVFGDDVALQTARVEGNPREGFTGSLLVGVAT
jgi:protocatechuate 3,4-dioxygenase beta subunit